MMPLAIVSRARLWLVPVVAGVAGAVAAWWVCDQRMEAVIAQQRAEMARIAVAHAAERQAAAEAAARRLADAQEAERAAVHALHATRARLDAANKRLKEALYGLPTAGRCGLSDGAVGLLDRAAGGDSLPQGTAIPDRAAAGATADPARPAASEAAVGGWIADAIRAYDECRARIDAIRQWDEVTHGR